MSAKLTRQCAVCDLAIEGLIAVTPRSFSERRHPGGRKLRPIEGMGRRPDNWEPVTAKVSRSPRAAHFHCAKCPVNIKRICDLPCDRVAINAYETCGPDES